MKIETLCVQEGYNPGNGEPRVVPICQSTTFKYESSDHMGKLFDLEESGFFYTRLANPTTNAVEKKIAALEGGVGAMMTASGFEVYDLGTDVLNEDVIAKVKVIDPDILGLSALLTTTMEEQGNIIEMLKAEGLREDVKVIIGGAPVNQAWADKITADGYSDNAIAAVKLAQTLLA